MSNSQPPARRSSIPPAGAESARFYNEAMHPSQPPFTKHKELATFLADDSTRIFLTFISFSMKRNELYSKNKGAKALLREFNSRMPKHLDYIFAELNPRSRDAIFALSKKIAEHSAKLSEEKGPSQAGRLENAILLARFAGRNAEERGATPSETALIVCGVFAASAKVFQSRKAQAAQDFIKLAERISSEMSTETVISFLWKIADSENEARISAMVSEMLRIQGSEKRISGFLSP